MYVICILFYNLVDFVLFYKNLFKNHLYILKMVDQQRQRVEQEMTKVVDDLDRSYLRKMQADMHRCAARCCDNSSYSIERLQQCIEGCSTNLNEAQNYVQKEIQHVQNRLQRCVMDCNDSIRDKMGTNPNESDVNKFTDMFESCAVKCVDKHVDLLPSLLKTMKSVIAKSYVGNNEL